MCCKLKQNKTKLKKTKTVTSGLHFKNTAFAYETDLYKSLKAFVVKEKHGCGCVLTCVLVKGVPSQSECDAALVTVEAAAMEEPSLSTDALQHIDPLTTEVALLAVHRQRVGTRLRLWSNCRCRTELRGHRRLCRLREKRSMNDQERTRMCTKMR